MTERERELEAVRLELEEGKRNRRAICDHLREVEKRLTTERARAEEAERVAGGRLARLLDLKEQLAAANARAGRLEERERLLRDFSEHVKGYLLLEDGEDRNTALDAARACLRQYERALSAAPQASTEQASPSPAVGEDWSKVEQGPFSGPGYSLAAQPAPGGTERCPECGKVFRRNGGAEVWRDHPNGYGCPNTWHDPTPAEPQGRPEQAGDRPVMLSKLLAALRSLEGGYDPTEGMFRQLREKLEE